jgi:hypothetical protein
VSTTQITIAEHDSVALRQPSEGWPAGTEGAVVLTLGDHLMVEVANREGECLDLLTVPAEQLRLVSRHRPPKG